MTTDIVKSMNDIETVADYAFKSGVMNLGNTSQAIMKIMAGREMGLGAFASLSNIHIIKDKPVIGANMMAAMIKASGKYDYRIAEFDKTVCKIMFLQLQSGGWIELGESSFSMDDAAAAGLMKEDSGWTKFPRNMLFARAISNGVRWYCPDLFAGNTAYTPGELDDSVEENVVNGEWSEASDEGPHLIDLIKEYGAAAVLEANGGEFPADDPESIRALEETLHSRM